MTSRWIRCLVALVLAPATALATAAEPFTFGSPSAVTQAGELKGRIVETRDGEELGRVQDFALDLQSGRIAYVVVSVGSFLIEDSLIAVAPGALRQSADSDGRLVLEADLATLRNAQRFSQSGQWPVRADVLAAAGDPAAQAEPGGSEPAPQPSGRGTATISDGERTATLSAGERSIREEVRKPAPATDDARSAESSSRDRPPPSTEFERLDSDGDGILNRAEIAHQLTRDDSYSAIDEDGSGSVDPEEFDALMDSRRGAGDDATSR